MLYKLWRRLSGVICLESRDILLKAFKMSLCVCVCTAVSVCIYECVGKRELHCLHMVHTEQ